jgi:hypothetical protein
MKLYNKKNPIAKDLYTNKYKERVIPNKKKSLLDKVAKKEIEYAKTTKDTRED